MSTIPWDPITKSDHSCLADQLNAICPGLIIIWWFP